MFTLGSVSTKLTLLTLYLRIFKPKVWVRRVIWLSIAATVLFYGTAVSVYVGLCAQGGIPLLKSLQRSQCVNITPPLSKLRGWYGLILDAYIAATPISLLWGLNLKLKQKLGVTTVFMTGLMYVSLFFSSSDSRVWFPSHGYQLTGTSSAVGISAVSLAQRYEAFNEGPKGAWDRGLQFFYGYETLLGLRENNPSKRGSDYADFHFTDFWSLALD